MKDKVPSPNKNLKEKTANVLRWSLNVSVAVVFSILFGFMGWMVSLFMTALPNSSAAVALFGNVLPWIFGVIGAMIGARVLLVRW